MMVPLSKVPFPKMLETTPGLVRGRSPERENDGHQGEADNAQWLGIAQAHLQFEVT